MTRRSILFSAIAVLCLAFVAAWWAYYPHSDPTLRYSYMGATMIAQRPAAQPATLALLVGAEENDPQIANLSARLLNEGVATVILSLSDLALAETARGAKCVDFGRIFHAIAKDAEHRMGFLDYRVPLLAGTGDGALAAYAGYRQSGAGMWNGVLTIGRTQELQLPVPPCFHWGKPGSHPSSYGIDTAHRQGETWVDMPSLTDRRFDELVGPLLVAAGTTDGTDKLPLTLVKPVVANANLPLVILYSGDGGWAGFDRKMAAEFASRGYETAGISSLEYFWREREPSEAAKDLSSIIDKYAGKRDVLLVGFSFGADVLPFVYDALSDQAKKRVVGLGLLGLSSTADFEFHLTSWADMPSDEARQTIPFIDKLEGIEIRCIRGKEETGSACPAISNPAVQMIALPGDHHFNDDAKAVVDALVALLR